MIQTAKKLAVQRDQQLHRSDALTVNDWLTSIGLAKYFPAFSREGYTNMEHINMVGLTEEDLNRLGIMSPMERRVVLELAPGMFSKQLKARIVSHMEVGGVDMYEVCIQRDFPSPAIS
jgi:hypothetical protein